MRKIRSALAFLVLALTSLDVSAQVYGYFPPPGMTYSPTTGLLVGTATGGAQGLGTINARGIYINGVPASTGSGSVSSVGLSAPSVFSVTGSPVTSAGTLGLTFATGQTANQFLATPNGSTGALGLRSIVAADLPSLAANPSGLIGLTANNGVATTYERSDATHALDQSIAPIWSAAHVFAKNASGPPASGQSASFSAPSGGVAAVFYGPTTGAAGFNLEFYDITNSAARGYLGFGTSTVGGAAVTDFGISPGAGGSLLVGTANGAAIGTRFGPNGNVTLNAPSSGTTLTVNQFSSTPGIINSGSNPITRALDTGANQAVVDLDANNAKNVLNFSWLGAGPVAAAIQLGAVDVIGINTSRGASINAPSSGVAWTVNGLSNNFAETILGGATTGQSYGPLIRAGTNSSDISLSIQNTSSSGLMYVYGDGGVVLGNPTGGDIGLGTINAASGFYLNGNTAGSTGGEWTTAGAVMGGATGGAKGGGTLNATGIYVNGASLYTSGTYTATLTGCTTSPTETVSYQVSGNIATVWGPALSCTSNALTMSLTGAPAAIQTSFTASCAYQSPIGRMEDNGALITDGMGCMNSSGTINFTRASAANFNGWTNASQKGLGGGAIAVTFGWSFTYSLQ